jgi:hypothetical protein
MHKAQMNLDLFIRYYRSLKLFNFAKRYLPNVFRPPEIRSEISDDEYQFELRAQSTGIDLDLFRRRLKKYLQPQNRAKLDWKTAIEDLKRIKPDPFLIFLNKHVDSLYEDLRAIPPSFEKSLTAVLAIVRSGPSEYPDEVYEAYTFVKNEITPSEVQEVITLWHTQRANFEKNLSYPKGLEPPKIFWSSALGRFITDGVPMYRFKSAFNIGGYDSSFKEFEESIIDLLSQPIPSDEMRSFAYDLCVISRSSDLCARVAPSIEHALKQIVVRATGSFWSEYCPSSSSVEPSVGTTALAALALSRLSSADWAREKASQAATWLLEKQNADGSWPIDIERNGKLLKRSDVHTTISTMEVVSRATIAGAKLSIERARTWLLTKQNPNGLWEDRAFALPQPTVLILETLDFLSNPSAPTANVYIEAAKGYLRKAQSFAHERDKTSRRLTLVTCHLGIESLLYGLIESKTMTKIFDKGQTIGLRSALSSMQTWMQQNRLLKANEILAFSNEIQRLAYLRDEIVHKAIDVSEEDTKSSIQSAMVFASRSSKAVLGFDILS